MQIKNAVRFVILRNAILVSLSHRTTNNNKKQFLNVKKTSNKFCIE